LQNKYIKFAASRQEKVDIFFAGAEKPFLTGVLAGHGGEPVAFYQ